jgi:hypothetical protein
MDQIISPLRGMPKTIPRESQESNWSGLFASTLGVEPMASAWCADKAAWEATAPPADLWRSEIVEELQALRVRVQKAFTGEPHQEIVRRAGGDKTKQLEDRLEAVLSDRKMADPAQKDAAGWALPWFHGRKRGLTDEHDDTRRELESEHNLSFAAVDEAIEKTSRAAASLTEKVETLRAELKRHGDFAQSTLELVDDLTKVEEKLLTFGADARIIHSSAVKSEVDKYLTDNHISDKLQRLAQARLQLAYLTRRCPWLSHPEDKESHAPGARCARL